MTVDHLDEYYYDYDDSMSRLLKYYVTELLSDLSSTGSSHQIDACSCTD